MWSIFIIFFLPDRPTHLHEREGDWKTKHFIGMALWKNKIGFQVDHTVLDYDKILPF